MSSIYRINEKVYQGLIIDKYHTPQGWQYLINDNWYNERVILPALKTEAEYSKVLSKSRHSIKDKIIIKFLADVRSGRYEKNKNIFKHFNPHNFKGVGNLLNNASYIYNSTAY